MAKVTGGILGNISGNIGGLMFSTRNNQTEVRNLPKKYQEPVTDAAPGVRARSKLLLGFLRLFAFFTKIGYPKKSKQRVSAFNVAFPEKPATDCCDCIYCILYEPAGKQLIEVPEQIAGKKIHLYLFLLSSMKEEVSGTPYKCLDLRESNANEKDRNSITYCNTISYEGAKAKKESFGKVTKHLLVPKAVVPKKNSVKTRGPVPGYTRNVLNEGIGSKRKPIRQKKP